MCIIVDVRNSTQPIKSKATLVIDQRVMNKKHKQIKYKDIESLKRFIVDSFSSNETYFKIGDGMKVLAKMDRGVIGVA